jgi:hypothetical protein
VSVSLFDFSVSYTPILRVRAYERGALLSSHVHYALKSNFKETADKERAAALCGKRPSPGAWKFEANGHTCQSCLALASRCVIHTPPLLATPKHKPLSPEELEKLRAEEDKGTLMTSKFAGRCGACGTFFEAGEKIWLRKNPDPKALRAWQKRHESCGHWPPRPRTSKLSSSSVAADGQSPVDSGQAPSER